VIAIPTPTWLAGVCVTGGPLCRLALRQRRRCFVPEERIHLGGARQEVNTAMSNMVDLRFRDHVIRRIDFRILASILQLILLAIACGLKMLPGVLARGLSRSTVEPSRIELQVYAAVESIVPVRATSIASIHRYR
jgi:hypothetical protein